MDNTRLMVAVPEEFLNSKQIVNRSYQVNNSLTPIIVALARINAIDETHVLYNGAPLDTNDNLFQHIMEDDYNFTYANQLAMLLFQSGVDPKLIKNRQIYKLLTENYEMTRINQQIPIYHAPKPKPEPKPRRSKRKASIISKYSTNKLKKLEKKFKWDPII